MTGELQHFPFTVCFIHHKDHVLMLYRNKPPHMSKWNGIGGHIEPRESPYHSCLRESFEETGIQLPSVDFRGVLSWNNFNGEHGALFIFQANVENPAFQASDEGELAWKPVDWVISSPEVVSNIHVFGPLIFNGAPPQRYHFEYRDEEIQQYRFLPLPNEINEESVRSNTFPINEC